MNVSYGTYRSRKRPPISSPLNSRSSVVSPKPASPLSTDGVAEVCSATARSGYLR